MLIKRLFILLVVLLACGTAYAADSSGPQVQTSKPGAKVNVDKVIDDSRVVISVFDAAENPVFGLGPADFSVTQSGRTANILSVQPLSESMDVPRNIVLVLDNSYSMKERRAINALLAGVEEMLKIVRPIDKVYIVVFENFEKVNMGGYELSVKTFKSSKPADLAKFTANAYSKGITGKTVLYDAILAGLELISEIPETEPRFMVVFSDGADLNSSYGRDDVFKEAQKIKGFSAYAIDYMPDPYPDKFLTEFTSQNHGKIWKAKSENSLVPIFQEVASKMLYYYVVSYLFPPTGSITASPSAINIDEISVSGGAPATTADVSELVLKPAVDTAYGITSWKVTVSNAGGRVAGLAGEGEPASELKVPLPAADLQALGTGGDLSVRMELKDKKGQDLVLDSPPVKVELAKTTASMTVAPGTLRFDEIQIAGGAPQTRMDVSELTLQPAIDSAHGIANWKVTVSNAGGSVAELAGSGDPAAELKVPLPSTDLQALGTGGDLTVRMELKDRKGQDLVLDAPPVKVEVAKTTASMTVDPATLRFDEIRISDAAPETMTDVTALTLRPAVASVYGIANWKVMVSNSGGSVAELSGEGDPAAELKVPLPEAGLQAIASGGDLTVRMELKDKKGHDLLVNAPPVKVEVTRTTASMTVAPSSLTIEEVRTIDASPMLSHVYFDKGSSEIPERYVRFAGPDETAGFDEQKFRDALEKYYQVLNIVGKRLTKNPGASVTLVGCNDNRGKEKGNKKLSKMRAEAVGDYLQTVWGIAPERITIEARNLPEMPSSSRLSEGQAENRRVEIRSDDHAITAPIQSTYFTNRIDAPALAVHPYVVSPHGIAGWKLTATNTFGALAEQEGEGQPAKEIGIPLESGDLKMLASGGDIAVRMELRDQMGHNIAVSTAPVKVNFIQTSQRLAQKEGMHVQEKYALILFDFDKDTIGPQNQDIVNGIVARIKALPQASVDVVGHTDNIGKEAYNIKLSERRALAVYNLLKAGFDEDPGDRIRYSGVGPNMSLYDNMSPEARSFNRTVTITLEYQSTE